MRKVVFTIGSFVLLALAAGSCSKNALDQPNFPGLRCAAGNVELVTDSSFFTKDYQGNRGTIIHGYVNGLERLKFNLITSDTTGTFNIDTVRGNQNIAYYIDGTKTYRSTSGSVAITRYFYDSLGLISGTFNFNGLASDGSTIVIQYGYFNDLKHH